MESLTRLFRRAVLPAAIAILTLVGTTAAAVGAEQQTGPTVFDPKLEVNTVVGGLDQPTSLAFLGANDLLVLEKATGQVKRVVNGIFQSTVLDLAVNSSSERGLLGIALHPQFPANPGVYLYWTQSTTGADSNVLAETPLLGNRVDRYVWNGSMLSFDRNVVMLRALQQDANQPARGNHDGGVIDFGHDGKLYVFVGDLGRRGQLQNLPCGPTADCPGAIVPDDQFGGPQPDNAHLTGVVLRLNADGTTPSDNPFFAAGAAMGGEVGANIQKIFSYGHRNSIGMDFEPRSGNLWLQENGDDTFTELNYVEPGMNGGWIQIMGPVSRIVQFKAIETDATTIDPVTGQTYFGLQQVRWPPTNIANTPAEAIARLFALPGSHYSDPEFSWKFEVSPAGVGFLTSRALGPQYRNDMFVGAARTFLEEGFLWRLEVTGNGRNIAVEDPRLADKVADNNHKFDITESESLLFGSGFGIATDIETGPNGNLYVVSLTDGAIYVIERT